MSIHVFLVPRINFDYEEMVERKASLANPKHQFSASQCGEHDCSPNKKRMGIIISIQVCLISLMNFDYQKNGGKKSISCKSKASILCIPMRRT